MSVGETKKRQCRLFETEEEKPPALLGCIFTAAGCQIDQCYNMIIILFSSPRKSSKTHYLVVVDVILVVGFVGILEYYLVL